MLLDSDINSLSLFTSQKASNIFCVNILRKIIICIWKSIYTLAQFMTTCKYITCEKQQLTLVIVKLLFKIHLNEQQNISFNYSWYKYMRNIFEISFITESLLKMFLGVSRKETKFLFLEVGFRSSMSAWINYFHWLFYALKNFKIAVI